MRLFNYIIITITIIIASFTDVNHIANAFPGDTESSREMLRGVKEFSVGVDLSADDYGFNTWELQNEIRKRILDAGINVAPIENKDPSTPTLVVNIGIQKIDKPETSFCNYCYYVNLSFLQQVSLTKNPSAVFNASTWELSFIGGRILMDKSINLEGFKKYIIFNAVDEFIKIYRSVNSN